MVAEVDTQMVPAVAQRLHLTPAALVASIAQTYSAVAKSLTAWPSIKPGAVELVRRQVASINDAAEINGLDFTPLPGFIGPGIALLFTGTTALAIRSRPQPACITAPGQGAGSSHVV